jgi:holo-[acyl-carrier protein] synthase
MTEKNEAFVERVFTRGEIAYCRSKRNPSHHFAGRFAAKEAVLKALGTGWRDAVPWTEIEIEAAEGKGPVVRLKGATKQQADSVGIRTIHASLTHAGQYAIAQVVMEK